MLSDEGDAYVDSAHQSLAQMQPMMSQYPLSFGQWLQVPSYTLSKPREIAIVGDPDSVDTQALLNVVRNGYDPSKWWLWVRPTCSLLLLHSFRIVA